MSTFAIEVQKHHLRRDGKYPVVIRLTHRRQKVYLKTEYYATEKQLDKEGNIKDRFLTRQLIDNIDGYEELIQKKLGSKINVYNAKELKAFLIRSSLHGQEAEIDFIAFAKLHIEAKSEKQKGRARRLKMTINSLIDYFGRDKIYTGINPTGCVYLPNSISKINQLCLFLL